jgi:hypothetical protein
MSRLAVIPLALTVLLLASGFSSARDLIFHCHGTVDSFKGSLWTKNNPDITVLLNKNGISFSGNEFLSGKNVKLCTDGGEIYFDDAECYGTQVSEMRRTGVFDSTLMTLSLSNTAENIGLNGYFTCGKADTVPGLDL